MLRENYSRGITGFAGFKVQGAGCKVRGVQGARCRL
jgi:hypothetical protein